MLPPGQKRLGDTSWGENVKISVWLFSTVGYLQIHKLESVIGFLSRGFYWISLEREKEVSNMSQ